MRAARPGFARHYFAVSLLLLALLSACSGGTTSFGTGTPPSNQPLPMLALEDFITGVSSPVGLEMPADGSGRIFVVQQGGTIRIIQNGILLSTPFLTIPASSGIESGGERGLLGLTFHPNFSANGRFFVNYTRRVNAQLQTVISEFTVSPPLASVASASTERRLMVVNQPADNHNGGQLAFGPSDGHLYVALGDGGAGASGNAQNTNVLLGKILRIDVDSTPASGKEYAIPLANPFAGGGGAPEIFAYGFRNPWRFSFDPPTQRLFVGDVGEGSWEEVDLVTAGGNYGWNRAEGNHCFPPGTPSCSMAGLVPPIAEYDHGGTGGSAITGGFLYRGGAIPALVGTYLFGDLSSGRVWGIRESANGSWQITLLLTHNRTVSAFGRDASGELYLVDYGNGSVLRIRAAP